MQEKDSFMDRFNFQTSIFSVLTEAGRVSCLIPDFVNHLCSDSGFRQILHLTDLANCRRTVPGIQLVPCGVEAGFGRVCLTQPAFLLSCEMNPQTASDQQKALSGSFHFSMAQDDWPESRKRNTCTICLFDRQQEMKFCPQVWLNNSHHWFSGTRCWLTWHNLVSYVIFSRFRNKSEAVEVCSNGMSPKWKF